MTLDGRLRIIASAAPPADADRVLEPLLTLNAVPGGGSGVLADTALVRELGGFDTRLSLLADWDLWIRLAAQRTRRGRRSASARLRASRSANMSWDVSRIGAEFATLDVKHAALRSQLGVRPDGDLWSSWIGEAERRSGNRWRAVAADLRQAARARTPRPLLRGGGDCGVAERLDRPAQPPNGPQRRPLVAGRGGSDGWRRSAPVPVLHV